MLYDLQSHFCCFEGSSFLNLSHAFNFGLSTDRRIHTENTDVHSLTLGHFNILTKWFFVIWFLLFNQWTSNLTYLFSFFINGGGKGQKQKNWLKNLTYSCNTISVDWHTQYSLFFLIADNSLTLTGGWQTFKKYK